MRSAVLTRVNISSSIMMIFCAILTTFRELEGEEAPFTLGALKLHPSTVVFSDHLDDGQADTAATVLRGVVEAEDFRLFTLLDAMPSVVDGQDTLPVLLSASQGQGAAAGHSVKGIDGEIEQRLFQLAVIAKHPERLVGQLRPQSDALAVGLGCEQGSAVVHHLPQIHQLDFVCERRGIIQKGS